MLETSLVSLGNPGSFDITDKNDPLYYIARHSHEQSLNLYQMVTEGFLWQQTESSDVTTIKTAFDTFEGVLATWLVTAAGQQAAGEEVDVPPEVPDLPATTIEGIVLSLLMRLALNVSLSWLKKRFAPIVEPAAVADILARGLLKNVGTENEFSILEVLANMPLKIMVDMGSGYQDVTYIDRDVDS